MTQDKYLTPEERRKRNHQEMVENILAIARDMMRKDGVAALSLNEIARRLGMTPPSIYTYFDSKDAIYDALFKRGFEEFGERMRQETPKGGSAYQQIHRAIAGHLAFAQENPDLYQLMMQRPVPGFVPSDESMAASLEVLQESHDWLKHVIEEGEISPNMPLKEAADLIFSLMAGLTNLHLANEPHLPVGKGRFGKLTEQAARLIVDAWHEGRE